MISIVIISKDEESLDDTLTDVSSQVASTTEHAEIIVVDASSGRLDHIRERHEANVRWVQFKQPPEVRISIPHQRNVGVREASGDIIVFTDAGCRPHAGWLERLVAPLHDKEIVVAGICQDISGRSRYEWSPEQASQSTYVQQRPTINFAFHRVAFDAVDGFDENFAYGSDIDFCWRLNDTGYRIRCVPDAVVGHDWGPPRRQRRRAYQYGKARARLYRKHRTRRRQILRNDPLVVIYPLFLLGLPLTLIFPFYPLLLLIPAWRNRSQGIVYVLTDHLCFGAGVLAELAGR